jgi:hypothetical protein
MIVTSVHAQVLGASFESLPALLRRVHDGRPRKEFRGRCSVQGGHNWLARVIALCASLPRRSHDDIAVHVVIERRDCPQVPCLPAIALARKLLRGEVRVRGAMPCMGLLSVEEILAVGHDLDLKMDVSLD